MVDFSFRQFQDELRKLEGTPPAKPDGKPLSKKEIEAQRIEKARAEFQALRARHNLALETVVSFFPEEEGVAYLQRLLSQPMKRRGRKAKEPE